MSDSDNFKFWDESDGLEDEIDVFAPQGGNSPSVGSPSNKRRKDLNQSGQAGRATTSAVSNPNQRVSKPVRSGGNNFQQRNTGLGENRIRTPQPAQMQNSVEPDFFEDMEEGIGDNSTRKKGKGKLIALFLVIVLVGVSAGVFILSKGGKEPVKIAGFDSSVFQSLQSQLNQYNPEGIDALVGSETADSYLAQEWAYANENEKRQLFITNVTKALQFLYPNEVGGKVKARIIDYKGMADMIIANKEDIIKRKIVAGIEKEDYDFHDECTDLLMEWFNEMVDTVEIPMTEVELNMQSTGSGFTDDIELDKLLFSSDEFHGMCDEFDKIMTDFSGERDEEYYADEEVHNPEYDRWYKIFKKRYDADNGKFHKGVSKWEPWYKRDSKNRLIRDKDGNKIVNYYTIKDKNGKDWVQPAETIIKKVLKTRKVPVEYVAEFGVPHCFLGAYYCQNEYTGVLNPNIRVGDGSIQHPAGVGTPIITHVKCVDGQYHDVRVTMKGYWVGQDAIDYSVSFSERNRGLDVNSVIQLITYEIEIENLEKDPITFNSEMTLADKNSNQSAKTGIMYSFMNENITINGGESFIMNDWATSTEIAQKYVAWGKSFNRQFELVYFKVLAGTGDIPSYSAYKAFTGQSSISGSINGGDNSESTGVSGKEGDTGYGGSDSSSEKGDSDATKVENK